MKRRQVKDTASASGKSTLRSEDIAKLGLVSRDVAIRAMSPAEKIGKVSREAAAASGHHVLARQGILSPRDVRIFRESMEPIDIGTLPGSDLRKLLGITEEILETAKSTKNLTAAAQEAQASLQKQQAAQAAAAQETAATSKSATLTGRERKIVKVIERGVKGLTYCRELDRASMRPRRSWLERGCPGRYAEAYRDSNWRQAIQEEKSYIARKARSTGNTGIPVKVGPSKKSIKH